MPPSIVVIETPSCDITYHLGSSLTIVIYGHSTLVIQITDTGDIEINSLNQSIVEII
jgi:hypothetical protein